MPATTIYKKCENCSSRCCSDAVSPVYLTPADESRVGAGLLTGQTTPASGNFASILNKKPDGTCTFFRATTSSHCAIYDKRPECCRVYSVRKCELREIV